MWTGLYLIAFALFSISTSTMRLLDFDETEGGKFMLWTISILFSLTTAAYGINLIINS